MKIIIQSNFSSGIGDLIVGMSEYLTLSNILKNHNCATELIFSYNNNKYLNNIKYLFDIIDKQTFNSFNSFYINHNHIQNDTINDCKHIYSLGNARPGSHWWDLYADEEAKSLIHDNGYLNIFAQIYRGFNLPTKISIIQPKFTSFFNDYIYKIKQKLFDNKKYSVFYFRNKDGHNYNNVYSKHEKEITELIRNSSMPYICSNSKELKQHIKQIVSNSIIFEVMEYNNIDYHFPAKNYSNDDEILKNIVLQAFVDIALLRDSEQIYLLTDWHRVSNFLFPATLNKVPINFYDE
jgi:hypothetical protein